MDIGTVITLRISKKDKICILLRKKSWIELDDEWLEDGPRIFIFTHYPPGGLFACPQLRAPMYIGTDDSEICCELMDGDRKVWIRDIDLNLYGKKV